MAPEPHLVSLQALAGAAERLAARDRERGRRVATDWLSLIEEARDRLTRTPFEPLPLDAFEQDDGDKVRVFASPRPVERLIEEALLPILHRALDDKFLDSVHAYRVGRSTYTAAAALAKAMSQGRRYLGFFDIASYFPSIDHARLRQALDAALEPRLAEVVAALLSAPLLLNGKIQQQPVGIPLGRPLSPLVANLFAVPLDEAMAADSDVTYLRYGDDLALATATPAALEAGEQRAGAALAALGLRLKPEKTHRERFDGTPVVYLGHAVDDRDVYDRISGHRLGGILRKAARVAGQPPPADAPAPAAAPTFHRPQERS